MDKKKIVHLVGSWQFPQEVPTCVNLISRANRIQLVTGPIDRLQGYWIEALGIKERGLIMVAKNRQRTTSHHGIKALARVRSVSNNIPQAPNVLDTLLTDIFQNGSQRFQVAMNVANQRELHAILPCLFDHTKNSTPYRISRTPSAAPTPHRQQPVSAYKLVSISARRQSHPVYQPGAAGFNVGSRRIAGSHQQRAGHCVIRCHPMTTNGMPSMKGLRLLTYY